MHFSNVQQLPEECGMNIKLGFQTDLIYTPRNVLKVGFHFHTFCKVQ